MRPLIGISSDFVAHAPAPGRERGYAKLCHHYYHAVLRAGGLPVLLPVLEDPQALPEIVAHLGGVILSGGDDYPVHAPTDTPHPKSTLMHPWRTRHDFALARLLFDRTPLPVLGICAGMQLMALAAGGSIHEHLPDAIPNCLEHGNGNQHPLTVERGSRLRTLLGHAPVVNSYHHQAVCSPGSLRAVARASDGTIEAVEHPDRSRFWVGVQWHPELMPETAGMQRLFEALIAHATRHRHTQAA